MRKKELARFTNMCMIRRGDQVVAQRRNDPAWPGVVFPGGHVEEGESFTDAVIREVWEETGLTIEKPRLRCVKDWYDEEGRYVVFFYIADTFTGELKSSDEGEVFWTTIDEMMAMDTVQGMEDMLKAFTDEAVSELYYQIEDGRSTPVFK